MGTTLVKIAVPDRLAAELPTDPGVQGEVLELGLRTWRIRQALDAYRPVKVLWPSRLSGPA